MAIVVKGDALDEASVKAAFDQIEEVDAVVSTVGGTPADARADSEVLPELASERPPEATVTEFLKALFKWPASVLRHCCAARTSCRLGLQGCAGCAEQPQTHSHCRQAFPAG